jgi:PAS domain S-box-containing protein
MSLLEPLGTISRPVERREMRDRSSLSGLSAQHGPSVRTGPERSDRDSRKWAETGAFPAAVLENMSEALVLTLPTGAVLYLNPSAERLFGYTTGELAGRSAQELGRVDPEAFGDFLKPIAECLSTGGPWEGNFSARRKDGTPIDTHLRVAALPVAAQEHWLWLHEDISERQRAERATLEREKLLETIIEHIPCAVFWKDVSSRYLGCNLEVARGLGLSSPDSMIGKSDRELPIDPADADFYRACDRQVIESGQPLLNFEEKQTRPDGTRTLLTSKVPLRDAAGAVVGVLGIYQDITSRKRAEEALRASERHLRAIIETTPECVKIIARDGTLIEMNHAGLAMVEAESFADLAGKPALDLVAPEYREAYRDLHRAVCEGKKQTLEFDIIGLKGTRRRLETQAAPIQDPGGDVRHLGITRDVTEQRRMEEQARHSTKMEAIGRLAGGIAHDFNNLLTVINGFAELLMQGLAERPDDQSLAEEIVKAGQRAADLTRQLLAFSRRQMLSPRVIDLNGLLADLSKMLPRLIDESIELHMTPSRQPLRVKADPGQIEQVIVNLAVNARDAMPHGGKLTIETREVELDSEYARKRPDVRPGRHALIAVSDTGAGMDAAPLARIWEPFFTTKGPEKGTGLGLATVYGIIKQSGGHVDAYSEVDVGSTFKIYLPCAEGPVGHTAAEAATGAPGGTETILLVEDEDAVRDLTNRVLGSRGYQVLVARDGAEALELASRHEGVIHLLITDVIMPGMSGREVARALTQARPDIRVLYVSGYTDDAVVRHGILEERTPFLQKPYGLDVLARKVREVLDRKDDGPAEPTAV